MYRNKLSLIYVLLILKVNAVEDAHPHLRQSNRPLCCPEESQTAPNQRRVYAQFLRADELAYQTSCREKGATWRNPKKILCPSLNSAPSIFNRNRGTVQSVLTEYQTQVKITMLLL